MNKVYDFNKPTSRRGTHCVKHDGMKEPFLREDLIPLWVADMDFETPDFIIEAIRQRLDHPILGYTFEYDADYLASANAEAVSLTLPLSDKPYRDKVLFPFFDGLIPEGWLLDIAEKNWKIDARDRMSLLVACCKDCIGAVGVEPIINEE